MKADPSKKTTCQKLNLRYSEVTHHPAYNLCALPVRHIPIPGKALVGMHIFIAKGGGGTCPTGTAYPHKEWGRASQGIHGIAYSL